MSDESKPVSPAEKSPASEAIQSNPKPENPPNPPTIPSAEKRPENNEKPKETWKDLAKWGKFERFAKAAEFFGIIGALVFICVQWKDMTVATNAAVAQSKILQDQLDEMKRSRELDERAWVFAEVQDNCLIAEGTNCAFQVQIKNVGNTPAVITGDWISISPNQNAIPKSDPPASGLNVTVIPNHFVAINSPDITTDSVISNITTYIWGTIWYKDIFGNTHWTQFCYALTDGGKVTKAMPLHTACDDTEHNQTN